MRLALTFLIVMPGMAVAEDWVSLDGAAIGAVLSDAHLQYQTAHQQFDVDGTTRYTADRPSWGSWAVRGDQYCSVWPPSAFWACYDVQRNGAVIRFIADDGSITDGTLIE